MILADARLPDDDWVDFRRDEETGIESVRAHFKGHAYDAHDHDELLLGVTHQGLQRFNCHREQHTSSPGRAILIEPDAVHDGHAAQAEGFTYVMLYLPQRWLGNMMEKRGLGDISACQPAFAHTLSDDAQIAGAINQAWLALHYNEGRLARDQSLDTLTELLAAHIRVKAPSLVSHSVLYSLRQMMLVRDYLQDNMARDVGLDELAAWSGIDRFRLSREFKKAWGLSPHAWLVRLRLRTARTLLTQGVAPSEVALQVGFADQSHLGRWFQRAYRLSPAVFQRHCTNVLY